jgi:hypothetical protein
VVAEVQRYRSSSLHRNSTATSTWLEHPPRRREHAYWRDHPDLCGLGQTALTRRSSSYLARNRLFRLRHIKFILNFSFSCI